jgi:hypothetical protein
MANSLARVPAAGLPVSFHVENRRTARLTMSAGNADDADIAVGLHAAFIARFSRPAKAFAAERGVPSSPP